MTCLFRSVFLTAACILAFDQAFASKVVTVENKNVRPNAGVVEMPAVSVTDEVGLTNSLSGVTKFSLVISSEANVRLSRTSLTSVSVSPATVRPVSVSDDLRTLSFESSTPLPSGVSISVSGIKVVAYNRYSPLHGLDLDVGSDGTIDAYDQNGIRVTDEYGAQDVTAPQEPVGLTGAFSTGYVTVTANPSGDLDFEYFKISFEDAAGNSLWNTSQSSLSARQLDLVSNTDVVRVQSVDRNGNLSVGVLLRKSSVEAVSSTGSTSGSGVSQTSTGSVSVPVEETSTGSVASTGSTVATGSVALEPAYVPTYRSSGLSGMIAGMDAFIASHEGSKTYVESEKAPVRIIRNDLAKYFESFFKTRIIAKKRLLVGQIRAKAAVLKDVILK
ncbi:MAG: hypothetical protein QMC36_02025 [Patescibacteria group bacterium]